MTNKYRKTLEQAEDKVKAANQARKETREEVLTEAFADLGKAYAAAEGVSVNPKPADIPTTLDLVVEMIESFDDSEVSDESESEVSDESESEVSDESESNDESYPPLSFQ